MVARRINVMKPDTYDIEYAALHAETDRLMQLTPFDAKLVSRHRVALFDLATRADEAGRVSVGNVARLNMSDLFSLLSGHAAR